MKQGRKPAHDIMTYDEMQQMETARVQTKLFSRDEDAEAKIQKLVAQTVLDLSNLPDKASLNDTELVKKVVKAYVCSCYESSTIPSKQGVARSLGVSRQAVEDFMRRNPTHQTTEFLLVVFDALADLLSNAALTNSVNLVLSIFLLKCLFNYKESLVVETTPVEPLGPRLTIEQIAEKYSILPDE